MIRTVYNRLLILAILLLTIFFMVAVWIAPAFAEGTPAAVMESPTPTPEATPIVIELIPSPTPEESMLAPLPTAVQDLNFVVENFSMPRDLEVLWLKVLWYCPIRTVKGNNPNPEKIGLLWALINEYQCGKVIDSTGKIMEYVELSDADKTGFNYTYLFSRDWDKLLMRPGDHDWFRNAVETNQPWHESEVNSKIVNVVYDVWQSELKGLNSGRTVPREYIYYAFVADSTGANRKLELYRTKEDLQNAERPYTWFLRGTLDK